MDRAVSEPGAEPGPGQGQNLDQYFSGYNYSDSESISEEDILVYKMLPGPPQPCPGSVDKGTRLRLCPCPNSPGKTETVKFCWWLRREREIQPEEEGQGL